MKPQSVFVTGGGGFLGRTVLPAFCQAGYEVDAPNSKQCDLRKVESLDAWEKRYDLILHLAAWTQAGDFCLHHPGEQWIINQQINTNLLTWWKDKQPQAKAVFIGTSCAYDPSLPLVEENYVKGEPIPSLYVYAMTKRMLEIGARGLHQQFGLQHMTLVPGTLCGPYYHEDGRQMHFIYDLARKILHAKNTGDPAVLWGDGYQRREILAVSDFVRAMLELIQNDMAWGELINVASGQDYTIMEFARMLCEIVGLSGKSIKFDASRYVGAIAKRLDISKLIALISWNPISCNNAIELVLDSFAEGRK